MLYPQKGSIAKGSRRKTPAWPSAAAVVSEPQEEPRKTPCSQSNASFTNGIVLGRRPPNRMADNGTPSGFCQSGSSTGHCEAGAVKREFGCAPLRPLSGVHSLPSQSIPRAGAGTPISSHHTSPSGVSTTFVKMLLRANVATAFGLDFIEVPGATPKKPVSGFIAYSLPSRPRRIQAISSPRHVTFQPGRVGWSIARLVFPHALGKAAAT